MFVIIVQPRVFYNLKKSMLCKHYGKEQNNSSTQQNLKNLNLSIDSVDDDDAQDFPALKTHMNIKIQSHTVQKTKVSYCEPPLKLNFNSSSQGVNCHQCSLWTFFKISRSTEILHLLEIFQDSFGLVPISVKRNLIWYFYWNNLHYSKRVFRYS